MEAVGTKLPVPVFLAQVVHVVFHLQHLGDQKSLVEEAWHGLTQCQGSHSHELACPDCFQEITHKPSQKESSIYSRDANSYCAGGFKEEIPCEYSFSSYSICLLAFTGFYRYNEIANTKACDNRISPDHKIIIRYKTIQLPQDNEVGSNSKVCITHLLCDDARILH